MPVHSSNTCVFTSLTTNLKRTMKNMALIILRRLKIVDGKATCNNKSQLKITTPINLGVKGNFQVFAKNSFVGLTAFKL